MTDEGIGDFHRRLPTGRSDDRMPPTALAATLLALLFQGDLDLPPGSQAYALFRDRLSPDLTPSDLLC